MPAERFASSRRDAIAVTSFSAAGAAIVSIWPHPPWTWGLVALCAVLSLVAWWPDLLWVDARVGTVRMERRFIGLRYGRREREARAVAAIRVTGGSDGSRVELRFADGAYWELPTGVERELERLAQALEAAAGRPIPIERRPRRDSAA